MSKSVDHFLKNLPGKPFTVQFVLSVSVEGHHRPYTEIDTYLLAAASIEEARSIAEKMTHGFSDAYNNSLGELVTTECLGIHRILEPNYVSDGRALSIGNFAFSEMTRPDLLVNEPRTRPDLPLRGQ
jgi:hypothetical protein